ncbi:uncharacterized protein [Triticum aestivum]|uniref:uncharacterized protein n=1 Tax=Triticum aestivum TaxID=4565 RepID=UPI001D01F8BF|nr:uncharacterized protein LOC123108463 [Triticum aestivum]
MHRREKNSLTPMWISASFSLLSRPSTLPQPRTPPSPSHPQASCPLLLASALMERRFGIWPPSMVATSAAVTSLSPEEGTPLGRLVWGCSDSPAENGAALYATTNSKKCGGLFSLATRLEALVPTKWLAIEPRRRRTIAGQPACVHEVYRASMNFSLSGLPRLRCDLWRTTGERGGAEHRRLPSLYTRRCRLEVLGYLFCGDLLSGWRLDGYRFPDRWHKDLQVFCAEVPGHVHL